MPFSGVTDELQMQKIEAGKFTKKDDIWKKVSTNRQGFVTQLLVVDPMERLSAEQALKHKWMTDRESHSDTALDDNIVKSLIDFGHASSFRRAANWYNLAS